MVNLSEPFIRRPVMTSLIMASLFLFGLFAYFRMPVSDLPNIDFPTIQVSVSYPGANPDIMANAVATPLEQNFMTIEGLQAIMSQSNTGSCTLILQFALDRDIDAASTDVQAQITRALPNLPSDLPNNPTYEKVNPSATPILYFALTSPQMSMADLYDWGNTYIGERLSMIEGVSQVIAYGAPYAVRVQVDPEQLAAKGIGIDQVTDVLRAGNVDLPQGTLFGNRDDFTIDVDGQLLRAPGYGELILRKHDGNLLKVKEIGRSLDSLQDDKYDQRFITKTSDEASIILALRRLPDGNTVRIVQEVNRTLEILKPQLPASLSIHRVYDQSEGILEAVADVKLTLLVAFLLVVLIVYISLGKWTHTIIPICALPMALFGSFSPMILFGFSIDVLSLLALTLSIGFLVDDAIVVLENNARHVEGGTAPLEAAIRGSKEVSLTVMSITLCLVAAFLPMLFMGGVVGRLFREFSATITLAVLLSGLVSLTLTPLLSARWIRPKTGKTRMEAFSERLNERFLSIYEPILNWSLRHPKTLLGIGTLSIVSSIFLFVQLPKDFLPPDDVGFIQGFTLARDGTSPFLMSRYHQELVEPIKQDPNVESVISVTSYSNPNEGFLFVRMLPYKQRKPIQEVISILSEKSRSIIGLNAFYFPIPLINLNLGVNQQNLYQYSLTGFDRTLLYDTSTILLAKLRQSPFFDQPSSDLRNLQPQLNLSIKRDRASDLHVNARAIENVFNYGYSDNKISTINAAINQYDVLIETLPRFYRDPSVLSSLYVRSETNDLVPLSEILSVQEVAGPLTINHVNGLSSVTLSFNTPPGISLGDSLKELNRLSGETLPPMIRGQVQGTTDVFSSSFSGLVLLFFLSFFVIYVILGILYESFVHPLTVMSALPPTLFGGLLTLYLFHESLSLYSFVGLILLIGIVLKNGILLIDFAETILASGKSALEAISTACRIRFRPILMTTVAAMMGAVPIAFGIGGSIAQNRRGLGLAVIGGLLFSQALTLLLTPVLYLCFEKMRERLLSARNRPKE